MRVSSVNPQIALFKTRIAPILFEQCSSSARVPISSSTKDNGEIAKTDESKTMSNNHILTRTLTVLFTGATAAALFLVAFAPSASIYAG